MGESLVIERGVWFELDLIAIGQAAIAAAIANPD
jgi:hypothetical protein